MNSSYNLAKSIRQNFFAGLLVTIPFGLTIFILFKVGSWIVETLSAAPSRIFIKFLSDINPLLFKAIMFSTGLTGTLLLVLIAGAVTRHYVGRKLLELGEDIISKIPFARTIYITTKQILKTLFTTNGFRGMKRVVIFEFPRKGIYSIGFVTNTKQDIVSGRKVVGVFLPTAFNPTGGYYIMVPEDEVKEVDISVEEAFKIIVSGGLASNQYSENPRES
ncbi:MAG: transporter [Deltaproteobacteria bacterium]|jgi:uncharacterized membrane protein|nr:MAG: transporter [Deltaproteobacteria bacterium]